MKISEQKDIVKIMTDGVEYGSQSKLAREVGEQPNVIWEVLNEQRNMGIGKLLKWCAKTGYELHLVKKSE